MKMDLSIKKQWVIAGKKVFFSVLLMSFSDCFSQPKYIFKGEASPAGCHCYSITPPRPQVTGAVWNESQINLNNPFDFTFKLFFDCADGSGGDGMAFVLHTSAGMGLKGEGIGFEGLSPSVGVVFDTYSNPHYKDPQYDYISIQKNGVMDHNVGTDIVQPMPISSTSNNVEDCQWYKFRITWDPTTKWLRTYINGVARASTQIDMVQSVFSGNQNVYWGFTGGTGGVVSMTFFCTLLDASFETNLKEEATCIGRSIQFDNKSESLFPTSKYYWDFGDGSGSTEAIPPPHVYKQPGEKIIKLAITDVYGCVSDTLTKKISVGSKPDAAFSIQDACIGSKPAFSLTTDNLYSSDQWYLNDNLISIDTIPGLPVLPAGNYTVKHMARSDYECGTDVVSKTFAIQKAWASAGRDSLVMSNIPFQLNGLGNGTFQWEPSSGLSNDNIPGPTTTLSSNQMYQLTVTTTAGCIAKDSVLFMVVNNPDIYVPTAFTPNRDGKNDLFLPKYAGVSKLNFFSVFNRWGELIFSTSAFGKGWDGTMKNIDAPVGTYIWIIDAYDIHSKKIQLRGSVTVIR